MRWARAVPECWGRGRRPHPVRFANRPLPQRWRGEVTRVAFVALCLLAPVVASAAYPGRNTDPDWPCQQIKIAELEPGAYWTGPPLDQALKDWSSNPAVASLAPYLAQRRVSLDEAKAAIAKLAKDAGADRQRVLLDLFAGIFQTLNAERESIIAGLDRFGARQKELAETIRTDEDQLQRLQDDPKADLHRMGDLTSQVSWETQVFKDRQGSIGIACDLPTTIEQRLFALGRMIQDQSH